MWSLHHPHLLSLYTHTLVESWPLECYTSSVYLLYWLLGCKPVLALGMSEKSREEKTSVLRQEIVNNQEMFSAADLLSWCKGLRSKVSAVSAIDSVFSFRKNFVNVYICLTCIFPPEYDKNLLIWVVKMRGSISVLNTVHWIMHT